MWLLNRIKKFFTPPNFEGDEKKTADANSINIIGLFYLLALVIASIVYVPFFVQNKIFVWIMILVLFCFYLAARMLLYRGMLYAAGIFLIISTWIICVGLAFLGDGINSPMMFALSAITIVVGLLFKPRFGVLFLSINILVSLGFALLAQYKVPIPQLLVHNPFGRWFFFSLSLLFISLTINSTVHLLNRAQQNIRRQGEALRLAETSLQESKEYNKLLFTSSRIPLVVLDTQSFKYIDCNQAAVKIYHFDSIRSVLGKSPMDFSAPFQYDGTPSGKKAKEYIDECMRNGESSFEWRHQRSDGNLWDAEVHLMAFKAHGKDLIQFSLRDITERKQIEQALKHSERRLLALMENGLDYISLLDSQGNLLWENPSSTSLLGYGFNKFVGTNIFETMHPDDREETWQKFANLVRTPGSRSTGKFRLHHADGSWRWIEAIVSNLLDDPAIEAIVVNYRDITERQQAEENILSALAEKEILLHEIHHRVKNNLQVIIALIQMRSSLTSDPATQRFLNELENQSRTMSLVYEQLYQAENLSEVHMENYLSQLISYILDSFGRTDLENFTVDADPSITFDVSQATPCGLIVNELFTNALKHAFPSSFQNQPEIRITLRRVDNVCHLMISDNGIGLPPEFDWRRTQSMGLRLVNLWVTHQLNGTLDVQSEPGTTYNIKFELKN